MNVFDAMALAQFDRLIGRGGGDGPAVQTPDTDEGWSDRPAIPVAGRVVRGEDAVELCDGVIDLMAAIFSACGRQLRSPKRHGRPVARVRQIGMYIAHVTLGMRMSDVAVGFGRDKSTVVYACHVIEDMRDDAEFDALIARAERIVRIAFRLRGCREGSQR